VGFRSLLEVATAISAVQVDGGAPQGGAAGMLPPGAWLYIGSVVAAGTVVVAVGPYRSLDWAEVGALGLLLVACESSATLVNPHGLARSAGTMASLAAVVLTGPVGAAIVGCCALLGVRRGPSLAQRLFNTAMCAVSAYLAGRAFVLVGGHVGVPGPSSLSFLIGPFAAAAVVHVAVNFALVRSMSWLARGSSSTAGRPVLDLRLWLTDLGYGWFGALIAVQWLVLGPATAVLVLVPVFVARWAGPLRAAQQDAYEAMVSALCRAVETKDPYTRGHSERVSRASVMIATEIGMRAARVAAIRYAGVLHDIGKLGVPTRALQKPAALTDEEFAAIMMHPIYGLEIVRQIGFLDEALAGIMHHHERLDGKGYPMGLAGDEIPEFARLIAVADAFDAMTSNRSYRFARPVSEAVAELRKCAGTQFDPAFVDAFTTAIERDGWTPADPR
jgi:putative nucleotidyltransferase with HDIG domain